MSGADGETKRRGRIRHGTRWVRRRGKNPPQFRSHYCPISLGVHCYYASNALSTTNSSLTWDVVSESDTFITFEIKNRRPMTFYDCVYLKVSKFYSQGEEEISGFAGLISCFKIEDRRPKTCAKNRIVIMAVNIEINT